MTKCAVALAALSATALAGDKAQVFILMGQSNMLGEGQVGTPDSPKNGSLYYAVDVEKKYQYLLDSTGKNWATNDDVRYVFTMGSGNNSFTPSTVSHNEFMTVTGKDIGPELGMGWTISNYSAASPKTLILKSCIGNRALGWDLLPPGSKQWDCNTSKGVETYAGYGDSPENWPKGTTPKPIGWHAGIQYDGDLARADAILANISGYFPGVTDYEVAGFMWWQGDRDRYDSCLSDRYEKNLVQLIQQLRLHYKAPAAKFVTASLGQTVMGSTANDGIILDAMQNVADFSKHPELGKDSVGFVYTHPLEGSPGSSNAHYGGDARTYMNVGEAMGDAMVKLLKGQAQ